MTGIDVKDNKIKGEFYEVDCGTISNTEIDLKAAKEVYKTKGESYLTFLLDSHFETLKKELLGGVKS